MIESLPEQGRYVVLEHDHPFRHWDLMLECGGALRTWRLPTPLTEGEWYAEPLPDHRLDYLQYEGPLSGDRGRVVRQESGAYRVLGRSAASITLRLGQKDVVIDVNEVARTRVRVTCRPDA